MTLILAENKVELGQKFWHKDRHNFNGEMSANGKIIRIDRDDEEIEVEFERGDRDTYQFIDLDSWGAWVEMHGGMWHYIDQ